MIHKCHGGLNGCLDKNGICKRGYSCKDLKEKSYFDEKGLPKYRRRKQNDLNIVPYHKQILFEWNGHINVEYCGKCYAVLYLYKYLFKGNKKLKVEFDNTSDLHEKDEIGHYIRGRVITSMDVMWRIYGFQTYPASSPSIRLIKAKMPEHVNILKKEGKMCDLEIYFRRPICLRYLKYTEFYNLYDYGHNYPKRYKKQLGINVFDNMSKSNNVFNITNICHDVYDSRNKQFYIYKRLNPNRSITRMGMNYFYMGEIYYLRLLLLHVPCYSFENLLEYEGIKYKSFQQSALARNLIENDNIGYECFKETAFFSTPSERRNLFVLLTLNGYVTITIYEDENMRKLLYEDYYYDVQKETYHNIEYSNNKLLEELQIVFEETNNCLTDFGLPKPKSTKTELDRMKLKYNIEEELNNFNILNQNIPNTIEQNEFLNDVYKYIDIQDTKIIFLQGEAGSGKSTVAKKIIHYTRSKGKIVLGCASTALAAQVYDDFDTFHGLFKYPVIDNLEDIDMLDDVIIKMENFPERKELIEKASVIIWDEFPSNEYHCFKTVYEYFDFFKNKIIICLGDWRQTPPVVKHGSEKEICQASILNSAMWHIFNVYKFSINMRLFGIIKTNDNIDNNYIHRQKQYAKMLLNIGEGIYDNETVIECNDLIKDLKENLLNIENNNDINNSMIAVKIPILNYCNSIEDSINFVFPNQFNNIESLSNSAILCATNESVDKWNKLIQDYNPNKENILLSYDKFDNVDDPKNILKNMITKEVLNRYKENNVPVYELILKENDICFIMRNLFKKQGLTNNTRVRIVKINKYSIRVCTINSKYPKFFNVPRINFKVNLCYGKGYTMTRKQFPLRLAYSMTYNKCQGQELKKCLVDITSPPFTHGHLYVALSRIRISDNIQIFYDNKCIIDPNDNIPIITNFVYNSLKI